MKLIVGLGNPGDVYTETRHNIGFLVLKALAKKHRLNFKKDPLSFALISKLKIHSQAVLLAMPLTFMNLSGKAIRSLLKRYKINLKDLLVVADDLDLELGRLKVKSTGSSGGHHGIQSIIEALKRQEFARLKIGIGKEIKNFEASDYVLSKFTKEEKQDLKKIIETASLACESWVKEGIDNTMNIFNRKREKSHE